MTLHLFFFLIDKIEQFIPLLIWKRLDIFVIFDYVQE